VVFPPSVIGPAAVGGLVGGLGGHFRKGMSRGEAKELGDLLEAGQAALIAIGESRMEEQLDKALTHAEKSIEKEIDADSAELKLELEEAEDLAFDAVEAGSLLRAAGVDLSEPEVASLTQKTEGWAAGLYLAALSLRRGGSLDHGGLSAISGADHHVGDYMRDEVLSKMTREQVEFLTRTSVLERMCVRLCDAVIEQAGSATTLESLARSNRFL